MNDFQRRFCERIHEKLEQRPIARYFLEINPMTLEHPTSERDMSYPVDLTAIKRKLLDGKYSHIKEWAVDVRHVWTSTRRRDDPDGNFDRMAQCLSNWFEKKWNDFPRSEEEDWAQKVQKLSALVTEICERKPIRKELIPKEA